MSLEKHVEMPSWFNIQSPQRNVCFPKKIASDSVLIIYRQSQCFPLQILGAHTPIVQCFVPLGVQRLEDGLRALPRRLVGRRQHVELDERVGETVGIGRD